MPSFVLWTFHLCSQWFQGLPDLLPHISDTEPVNNFASQTGLLHPGGMKYFQIAPWVCIPLLTCRGVDATNSADSGSDLQLNESPFSKNWQVLGPFEIGTRGT